MPAEIEKAKCPLPGDRARALFVIAALFLYWVLYALKSSELYSDDDVSHFLMARYAPWHPKLFLDIWGRPLFTLLYCPGSQLGLTGARLTSAVIGAVTCWLVYLYAKDSGYPRA